MTAYSRSMDNTPKLESNSGSAPERTQLPVLVWPQNFDSPRRLAISYIYV